MGIGNVLKDPLVHFLAAGVVLFLVLSAIKPSENADRIIVDRPALLSFIQFRSKAFEPRAAAALLDAMSAVERERLINDFIREEALYREAQKLGFDQGDYVIRRRMVQKLEFMAEASTATGAPDDAALAVYYEANKQDYYLQPAATFAHIFFSTKEKSPSSATLEAMDLLRILERDNARFEDATQYGDRFLFHTNYVERTHDFIKSHFGDDATETVFSATTPLNQWSGPVLSEHGAHLIFAAARSGGRVPPLDEVKSRVAEDLARAAQREQIDTLVDAIVEEYAPVIKLDDGASLTATGGSE